MGSQTRPTSAVVDSPWQYDDWNADVAPMTGLWTLDGVFENIVLENSFFTEKYVFANQLGFTTSGVDTIQTLEINLQTMLTTGLMTSVDISPFVGIGEFGTWTILWGGATETVTLSATPQNKTLSWTPAPLAKGFIKANMAASNFFIGMYIENWNATDTLMIDYWDFTINYTDLPPTPSDDGSTFRQRGGNRGRLFYGVR